MNQDVFDYILNLIQHDPDYNLRFALQLFSPRKTRAVSCFRRKTMQHLCRHPPFRQNQPCPLNNPTNAHRLWFLITYESIECERSRTCSTHFRHFAYDNQIRNDLAELYQIMFGLNRRHRSGK